ncbi:MAG: amino acid permease [Elusimicrobia bacterium HGW-Elusimicrobia-3]|nr:MAG: amino acid permease [Elusimicrobia bacterium HGW-Elusimicrobia-3]
MTTLNEKSERGHDFGTAPVFLAAISTILGAILFLRFGYAVGHVGLMGGLGIILIAHMITIPTALAVSEIATNQKVEGGGEYFIISRSFGRSIGGTIGIALYFSQAVSVAFYLLAFAEAFAPIFSWINSTGLLPFPVSDMRLVSVPFGVLLIYVILKKGASLGVSMLWGVFAVLVASLVSFFLGSGTGQAPQTIFGHIADPDSFQKVFAICFPAFTGMTAGVGLSGDLKNPRWSIPAGTMLATVVGMGVYVAVVYKLAGFALPENLASDQFIMAKIAAWGPLIYFGLAAATISSAIGSLMIAPRTLQALAKDGLLPGAQLNALIAKGRGKVNEPYNATLVSGVLAIAVIMLGNIDAVAQIISMFFMVTYGALCGISFLEHFAANPSYRPAFRTRWFLSLFGAVMCILMMFQMSPLYAIIAIASMTLLHLALSRYATQDKSLTAIFQGVLFQLTRHLHMAAQKRYASSHAKDWRPSFIMVSEDTLEHISALDFLRWISHRYGFSTLIHYIPGKLSAETTKISRQMLRRLIEMTASSRAAVFVDTVVSPTYETALAQMTQVAGISGLENNSVLFEIPHGEPDAVAKTVKNCRIVAGLDMNICILRSSARRFGYRRQLHVWLTQEDEANARLMILLAFIIAGHPDWKDCEISVFASFPKEEMESQREKLTERILSERLPISLKRLRVTPYSGDDLFESQVVRTSAEADLTLLGFDTEELVGKDGGMLSSFTGLHDVLFVDGRQEIAIR